MSVLKSVIDAAPIYQATSALDCTIWICDSSGIIAHCQPAKTFDMTIGIGEKVKENGALDKCIKTGKGVSMIIPREMYGNVSKAIAIPLFEDNKIVGAISVGTSLGKQDALHTAAQTIAATTEQISATSEELAATAANLASSLEMLKDASKVVGENIEKTDDILRFVGDIAASSNLLGLNAAIEAARAGEHGRGFSVVADEIRKMADNSAKAVKDIKTILETIRSKTLSMTATIETTAQLGERQAAASEEISASMQQLASTAGEVEEISKVV